MNWKIIAALGIPSGLLIGGLTTLGILGGLLMILVWVVVAMMARKVILIHAPHRPFIHGFFIAALAGLISGNVTALNMDVFFASTNYLEIANTTADEVNSANFVIGGGINGILFGLLAGGIAGWKTRAQAQAMADEEE